MSELIDFPSEVVCFIKVGPNNYYVRRLDGAYLGEVHLNKSYQYVFSVIDMSFTEPELSSILSFLRHLTQEEL